jgi:hypothetical protein
MPTGGVGLARAASRSLGFAEMAAYSFQDAQELCVSSRPFWSRMTLWARLTASRPMFRGAKRGTRNGSTL